QSPPRRGCSALASTPHARCQPCISGRTTHEAPCRCPLGCGPELPLQLSHVLAWLFATGVVRSGLAGHSLALTRLSNMTTAGTLPSSRVMPHGLRPCSVGRTVQYYAPLRLPLRPTRPRLGLIRARLP